MRKQLQQPLSRLAAAPSTSRKQLQRLPSPIRDRQPVSSSLNSPIPLQQLSIDGAAPRSTRELKDIEFGVVTSSSPEFLQFDAIGRLSGFVFRSELRSQLLFLATTLLLIFLILIFTTPQRQDGGLLPTSNQVHRAVLGIRDTSSEGEHLPSIDDEQNEASIAQSLTHHHQKRRTEGWDKRTFSAVPSNVALRRYGSSPDQLQRYESEFAAALARHNNAVSSAFYEYLRPFVFSAPFLVSPLQSVDQAVVLILPNQKKTPWLVALRHTLHMIGTGWGVIIFHAAGEEDAIIAALNVASPAAAQHIELQRVSFPEEQGISAKTAANPVGAAIGLSSALYERVDVETLLFIHPDVLMLRSPYYSSAKTLNSARAEWDAMLSQWGYLAPPWERCKEGLDEWCRFGGAGISVSLRKRSVFRELSSEIRCGDLECVRHDLFQEAERSHDIGLMNADSFVARVAYAQKGRWEGRLAPPRNVSEKFGVEKFRSEELAAAGQKMEPPFFVHQRALTAETKARWMPMLAHVRQYYEDPR